MSYEEFLDLPVDKVTQISKNIRYKMEHKIPFNQEELQFQKHFIRYTKEIKLQEEKMRLEYYYSLDAYEKDK